MKDRNIEDKRNADNNECGMLNSDMTLVNADCDICHVFFIESYLVYIEIVFTLFTFLLRMKIELIQSSFRDATTFSSFLFFYLSELISFRMPISILFCFISPREELLT